MYAQTDNHALLLFRVGPVLCCAPSLPIESIIEPRPLTRSPGSSAARPGMFRHAGHIVSVLDLRTRFGVEEAARTQPGRVIIVGLAAGYFGLHVDEIIEVINMPTSGWGTLPALLPRGVFSRTLLWQDKIWLYAEFDGLRTLDEDGYLRQYIAQLQQAVVPGGAERHAADVDLLRKSAQTPPARRSTEASPVAARLSPVRPTSRNTDRPAGQSAAAHTPASTRHTHDTQQHAVHTRAAARQTGVTARAPNAYTKQPSQAANIRRNTQPRVSHHNAQTRTGVHITHRPVNTAGNASRPSMQRATSARQIPPAGSTAGVFAVLSLFVLFVAGLGLGTWYLVNPADDSLTIVQATVTPPAVAFIDTPATVADMPAVSETEQVLASDTITAAPAHPASAAPTLIPAASETTGRATNNDRSESTDALQASIERNADGITITVEVPEDDPIFQVDALQAIPAADETASTGPTSDMIAPGNTTSDTQASQEPVIHVTHTATAQSPVSTAPIDSVEIIHIVVKGDTLWHIAKRYVENPYRYPELARLSNIRNPDLIYPGDRVRILKRKRKARP